jgi:hypothetical protein
MVLDFIEILKVIFLGIVEGVLLQSLKKVISFSR